MFAHKPAHHKGAGVPGAYIREIVSRKPFPRPVKNGEGVGKRENKRDSDGKTGGKRKKLKDYLPEQLCWGPEKSRGRRECRTDHVKFKGMGFRHSLYRGPS